MQEKALFSQAFLLQPSLTKRLFGEGSEAIREFTTDPKAFIGTIIKGEQTGGHRRKTRLRFGLATGIVVYTLFFFFAAVLPFFLKMARTNTGTAEANDQIVTRLDLSKAPEVDVKDKKKAGGGGGGGRQTPTRQSRGQLPRYSLATPLMAPRPEPQLRPPALPMMETVQVDPRLEKKRDELAPTGLPTGAVGPPSAGPGSDGGMGTGTGGGMGPGHGTGHGPGSGLNEGDGPPNIGGNGRRTDLAINVDSKPRLLYKPQPLYTEEARKNKIMGTVRARITIGADGAVKKVAIISGLPYGLNEEAISAAYKMKFSPAMKSGQPVAYQVAVDIEFTIR